MRRTSATARKPSEAQAQWLRRIAHSPLMKTYVPNDPQPRFSLQDGSTVPHQTATLLIRNGWVRGRRDGLFGDEQSYAPANMVYEALRP
jgi:hypothetical protein